MARTGRNKRRRVQQVDASDATNEPEQLHWFGQPAEVTTPAPALETMQLRVEPALFGLDAHLHAQHYDGDPTNDQVFESVQNAQMPVYGKVI